MRFFRRLSNRQLLLRINERTIYMSQEIDDLNAAVAVINTAVGDAAKAIHDQADKLAAQSSTNPSDVEAAANKLRSIAKTLEAVVTGAGEPVTEPDTPTEPTTGIGLPESGTPTTQPEQPPLDAVEEGASPNT